MGEGTGARASAAAALVLTIAMAAATPARADAGADMDAAEAAYAALDYDRANSLAQKVVATPGLTHDQLVRGFRLLGRTYAVLGKAQQALDAFERLLTYAPDEKGDPSQTPRIQEAFAEAQGFWAGFSARPGLEASTVALRVHMPGTLRVELRDPTHQVKQLVVGVRWGTGGAFETTTQAPADTVNIDIPAGPPGVARLDYYVIALDGQDDQAFTVGDASAPRTVLAEAPAVAPSSAAASEQARGGSSIFASPVFWIAAGLVVAGGATGAYFAARKPSDVTAPPTAANLAPSLFCGGTADGRCH